MEPIEEKESGCCQGFMSCLLGLCLFLSQLVIFGVVSLSIYWVFKFKGGLDMNHDLLEQFNTHIVLMVAGIFFFSAQGIIAYRVFDCCKRSYAKVLHMLMQLVACTSVAVAFYVVFTHHEVENQLHFQTVHSWLALATCGLLACQVVFGFFSFVILLCCRKRTLGFRSRLVPIHASFGLIIFAMAVATAITGFLQASEHDKLKIDHSIESANTTVPTIFPGTPQEQSDMIIRIVAVGLLALLVLLPVITNNSLRGGRGVFYAS